MGMARWRENGRSSHNKLRLILLSFITICVFYICYYIQSEGLFSMKALTVKIQVQSLELLGSLPLILGSRCQPTGTQIRGISTPGCNIPDLDPCDESVRKYIRPAAPLSCGGSHVPLTSIQNGRLVVDRKLATSRGVVRCEYSPILHDTHTDTHSYADPVTFISTADVTSARFVRVYCFSSWGSRVYTNFHHVVVRNKTEKRGRRTEEGGGKLKVLLLGLDGVSRLNLARQLPKYKALLEKEGFVGMNGYHKVAQNTFVNIVPALTGQFVNSTADYVTHPFDGRLIWQDYMAQGAKSLYGEDSPDMISFNLNKRGFDYTPTDYYFRPMSTAMYDEPGWYGWKIYKTCAGGRPEPSYTMDFVRSFLREFRDDAYIAFEWYTRLNHNDINDAAQGDDLYTNYLSGLIESGDLEDTVVLSFSDHGNGFGPFRRTMIGEAEERLPFMYVRLPAWLRAQCPECEQNLRHNADRLTTPFDVYSTLRHLLTPQIKTNFQSPIPNGFSMLTRVPDNRTCEDALISSMWCSCRHFRELSSDDPDAARAASALLHHLNDVISDVTDVCAPLTLKSVTSARVDKANTYGTDYRLTVVADPSEGVFQGLVRKSPRNEWSVVDGVERLDTYGKQSYCVSKYYQTPVCFCKSYLKT